MRIAIGARQQLDQEAADAERRELGGGPDRRERAVGSHEARRVGRSSAGRRCRPRRRTWSGSRPANATSSSWASVSHAADGCDRDRDEQHRPAEVGPDHHRTSPRAGRPRHRRPGRTTGRPGGRCARTRATSNAPASSDEDRHEWQRHPGDERAEDRDRCRRPHADERAVLPERARRTGCARAHSLPGRIASQTGLRYTPPASVRQNSRTTRAGQVPVRLIQ